MNAVSQELGSEVDDEPKAFVGQFQVSQTLSLENGVVNDDGLAFDNHELIDEHVQTKLRRKKLFFVVNRYLQLSLYGNTAQG